MSGLVEQWHKRSGGVAAAVELLRWGMRADRLLHCGDNDGV